MAVNIESDEALARRLQAQELGLRTVPTDFNSQTPLIRGTAENPTVINARLNEISSARATVAAIFIIHFPQVLAAFIVLSVHWSDDHPCDFVHRNRWNWWTAISAVRMGIYTSLVCFMHMAQGWLENRVDLTAQLTNARNIVDAIGLVWFVVGNMWIFGDDSNHCNDAGKSPVYNLAVAMLIINYIQICLPCIIAILLIPVFCFCMPCLIRLLARIQVAQAPKGATDDAINAIPLITVKEDTLVGVDSTCPICLNDMALEEQVRLLPCKHIFHSQCVDEWLRVNASCPTCRMSLFQEAHDGTPSDGSDIDLELNQVRGRGVNDYREVPTSREEKSNRSTGFSGGGSSASPHPPLLSFDSETRPLRS